MVEIGFMETRLYGLTSFVSIHESDKKGENIRWTGPTDVYLNIKELVYQNNVYFEPIQFVLWENLKEVVITSFHVKYHFLVYLVEFGC